MFSNSFTKISWLTKLIKIGVKLKKSITAKHVIKVFPITLVSLLYKITLFSPKINTYVDKNKINQKSRTEIIELYRSTMINKKNKEY